MNKLDNIDEKNILRQLQDTLQYVTTHSAFYKKHFESYHAIIADFNAINDIQQLPFTTKEDIARYNEDFICIDKSEIIEYTSTSGTLGSPVFIAQNKNDIHRLAKNEAQALAVSSITKDDIVQLSLTLDRQFMAGIAYYLGLQNIGAKIIRMGPTAIATQLESIFKYNVTALITVPSFLLKLIQYCEDNNIAVATLPIKKAICIGEPIRDEQLLPNSLHQKISEKWDIALYSTYASTEMQTAFAECSERQGGHLQPDLLFVEILDENNLPVAEGEVGEVVITTIGVQTMPLVRYRTGDLCKSYASPCNCGRNTIRLGPVLGRKNQLIKLKGTTLYPASIINALNELENISDYFVEIIKDENKQDSVVIFLCSNDKNETITELLKAKLRVSPQVIFCDTKTIQQKREVLNNRKIVKLIDLREEK